MRRFFVVLLLVFMLLGLSSASRADVYYQPGPVYVRPDPSYQMGQAIGNLLGALFENSRREAADQAAREERERYVLQLQDAMDQETRNATTSIRNAISQYGINATWDRLIDHVYSRGYTPYTSASGGIASIAFSDNLPNGVRVNFEYSFNLNSQQCRALLEILPLGLRASSTEYFTLPVAPAASETTALGSYLGIVTSMEKTADGGFTVLEVDPNGLCGFAGVQVGDIITKIDTYALKDHDIERVAAYINLRRQQRAIIKATVLRNGQPKVIEMQL